MLDFSTVQPGQLLKANLITGPQYFLALSTSRRKSVVADFWNLNVKCLTYQPGHVILLGKNYEFCVCNDENNCWEVVDV